MPNLDVEAGRLVERSRLGDQNATAMIQMVAEKAKGGGQAAQALTAIQKYIKQNPHEAITMHADIDSSRDSERQYQISKVQLANGPAVSLSAVLAAASFFSGEPGGREFFTFGYVNYVKPFTLAAMASKFSGVTHYLKAGAAMAYARALQRLRLGGPVSDFSTSVGWELGE